MKTRKTNQLAILAVFGLMALANVSFSQTNATPRTFCRFVPERADDFAWENDKVAFRAYGPALRSGVENSGIDCWVKRVPYPIINKWYKEDHDQHISYHEDHGEGYDCYKVGSSRGCGGLGLWRDGKLVTSETFVGQKVIKCEPEESVFELYYAWDYKGHSYKETKRISIKLGDQLFRAVSTFWKDGKLATGLPIAIGVTTHDGAAKATSDVKKGWMACWETIDGYGLGTGVVIDPARIKEYKLVKSDEPYHGHALVITQTDSKGQVDYWAGFGWERAGEIKTSKAWDSYLATFAAKQF